MPRRRILEETRVFVHLAKTSPQQSHQSHVTLPSFHPNLPQPFVQQNFATQAFQQTFFSNSPGNERYGNNAYQPNVACVSQSHQPSFNQQPADNLTQQLEIQSRSSNSFQGQGIDYPSEQSYRDYTSNPKGTALTYREHRERRLRNLGGNTSSDETNLNQNQERQQANASERFDDRSYSQSSPNKKRKISETSQPEQAATSQPSLDRPPQYLEENKIKSNKSSSISSKHLQKNLEKTSTNAKPKAKVPLKAKVLLPSGKSRKVVETVSSISSVSKKAVSTSVQADPANKTICEAIRESPEITPSTLRTQETASVPNESPTEVKLTGRDDMNQNVLPESLILIQNIKQESSLNLPGTEPEETLEDIYADIKKELSDAETDSNPDLTEDNAGVASEQNLGDFDELSRVTAIVKTEVEPEEELEEDLAAIKAGIIRCRNLDELIVSSSEKQKDVPAKNVQYEDPLNDGDEPFDDDEEESSGNSSQEDDRIISYLPMLSQPPPT